jgi:hypothetical protein
VAKAKFDASAHDYGTTFTLHDGGQFTRNCTKCHDDPAGGFVHSSASADFLAGTMRPNGTAANLFCYRCHGSATVGANTSGKDIATQVAKDTGAGSGHPVNADNVHDSVAEQASAAFGNKLGGPARHASCLDCHDPHEAKAGTRTAGTNKAGPPLEGAWGAELTSSPAFWTAPAAGNFTKKVIVAGTDVEATLCFKCHSSYYWGTTAAPTSPSGGFAETDVAKEFNPANGGNWATAGTANSWSSGENAGGFHPVLANAGGNLGAINLANLVTTNIAYSKTARNTMTCTDCHESNTPADPNGPHGSTAGFILRGPNTTWSNTVQNGSSIPAGTFCLNCHSNTFASSRYSAHSRGDHAIACMNCHAAIPHGGPRPGMLVAPAGSALGTIAGWDSAAPYSTPGTGSRLYIKSYPASQTTGWSQSNCGCNGTGH